MSSKERQYQDYLHDIHDAAVKARRFMEGIDYEQFVADDRTTFAVIRALEVIGEARKRCHHQFGSSTQTSHGVIWQESEIV